MHESILLPTDGSKTSANAVEYGLDLADAFDAHVHVLYVVEKEATYILTVGLSDEETNRHKEYGEETVTEVIERASERGLDGTGVVRVGRVAEEIVEYAEENDIGTIVLGQQGRDSAIDRYLGGTAQKVMKMTDIPVTSVGP